MEITDPSGKSYLPKLRRTRAVFALLALVGPKFILREELTSLLWSRREREQARASLRQCVYELRDLLQPLDATLLHVDRDYLELRTDDLWIDATLIRQATQERPDALDLFRGPLLHDLKGLDPAFDGWIEAESRRIVAAAQTTAELALAREADPPTAIGAAERLLRIERTHEGAWRALMLSHAQMGDNVKAAATYDRCTAALAAAGASPSPDTVALLAQIRPRPFEPVRPPPPQSTLPRLAGRDAEVRLGLMPLRALDGLGLDFAHGLSEELTTALVRFRGLSCIVLPCLAAEAQGSDALRAIGLDFVIEGSVQCSGDTVRVTFRLRNLNPDGEVIWSQRFQQDLSDILALQSRIASQTVAQMHCELMLREQHICGTRPFTGASAGQFLSRAIPAIHRLEKVSFLKAGTLLAESVKQNPTHAASHAWWAYWHLLLLGQGWAEDPAAATARTSDLTTRAISLDPYDAYALTLAGHVRAFTHRRIDEGLALHDRALTINPNLPLAWLFSGLAHTYAGQHSEAVLRIRQAKSLSPLDPLGFFFDMGLTLSHMLLGENDVALKFARCAVDMNPEFSSAFKCYLSTLGHLQHVEDLPGIVRRLLSLEPGFTVTDALARSPLARLEDRERFAEGLRRGGLPR